MGKSPDYFANHSPPRKAGLHHGKGKEGKLPGCPARKKGSASSPQGCQKATSQSAEKSGARQSGQEAATKTRTRTRSPSRRKARGCTDPGNPAASHPALSPADYRDTFSNRPV